MQSAPSYAGFRQIGILLRGEADSIRKWIEHSEAGRIFIYVAVIFAGAGCYGAAMGAWRDSLNALYVAIKFPLIILLVTLGNAMINGMLAPLLGLNISFRQSFMAILMSFTIAAAILGSFSPLVAFMLWNAPTISEAKNSGVLYSIIQLTHVFVIAFAGIVANLRLIQLLQKLGGSARVARRVLFVWLVGNLFLGSQLSWILRPFIGSPDLPVEFLRPNAFHGNFYETVFGAAKQLLSFD